jgi:hypothetical protein
VSAVSAGIMSGVALMPRAIVLRSIMRPVLVLRFVLRSVTAMNVRRGFRVHLHLQIPLPQRTEAAPNASRELSTLP